jgi:hypothetical protein
MDSMPLGIRESLGGMFGDDSRELILGIYLIPYSNPGRKPF